MTFQDLILRFDPVAESERYRLVTFSPTEGQVFAPFVSPFGSDRIRRWQDGLDPDELHLIGSLLYKRLFTPEVQQAWLATRRFAERQGFALRLKLILDDVLDQLPWEFLSDPELRQFLSLEQRIPIVRFYDAPGPARRRELADGLHVLQIAQSARAAPVGNGAGDGAEPASQALIDLVAHKRVTIEYMHPGELARAALRSPIAQILHVEGEARHNPATGELGICLSADKPGTQWVTLEQLAKWLFANPNIRLVLLDANGTESGTRGAAALASELVARQIVPAAIAPQFPLNPVYRAAFLHAFYGMLAKGALLDLAMTEGRRAIAAMGAPWEWGAPALYSALRDDLSFVTISGAMRPEFVRDPAVVVDGSMQTIRDAPEFL